jgi:integrase
LEQAREDARQARLQLRGGIDPLDSKRAAKLQRALDAAKSMSFKECAQAYFDQHERKWRNAKHRAQFLSTLATYAYPKIGPLPVAALDTGLVLKCIEPIWLTKTETASRVRSRIEAVLDWATVRGYRKGDNPARWMGHLSEVLPARGEVAKVNHHPALTFTELPSFMEEVREREGMGARALELTILTAARTGEIIGARWPEFDLKNKVWTVPAGRMKGEREHKVPLSRRAVDLLEDLPRKGDFVFPGPKKGTAISNMAMATVLKRMRRDDITVHGFRSTFRDWAAERTNYPNHVVEMVLAHVVGNKVEAAYRRGDLFTKRAQLMETWARYCESKPVAADNITPLRAV